MKHHCVDFSTRFLLVNGAISFSNCIKIAIHQQDQHTHGRTEECKCICYLNNVGAGQENKNYVGLKLVWQGVAFLNVNKGVGTKDN